jgi:hypothetical protein
MGELAILTATDDQTVITVNSLPFVDKGMYVDLMDASDNTRRWRRHARPTPWMWPVAPSPSLVRGPGARRRVTSSSRPIRWSQIHYSLYGLGAWLSDVNPPAVVGNLGGINRSTVGNDFYKGNVLSNGGTLRAFTEDLLIDGENLMRERGGVQPEPLRANGNILKRYHGDVIKDKYFAYNKIQAVGAGGEKVGFGRQGMDLDNSPDGTGETPYTLSGKPFHRSPTSGRIASSAGTMSTSSSATTASRSRCRCRMCSMTWCPTSRTPRQREVRRVALLGGPAPERQPPGGHPVPGHR